MVSLLEVLVDANKTNESSFAVRIPDGRDVTYKQFLDEIHNIQAQLTKLGKLQTQDTIAIVAPNGLPFLVSFLGAATARMKVAPLNPAYSVDEFSFYLKDTDAKAILITEDWKEHSARVAAANLHIPVWELCSNDDNVFITFPFESESFDLPPLIHPHEDDIALFLHTSGTTSTPKGVPLTHLNIYTSITNISNTYKLSSDDTSLVVMPLFHVHGLIGATLSTFKSKGTVVVPPRFSASEFWNQVLKYNVSWYSAVPTIHQILLIRAETEPIPDGVNFRFIRSSSSSLAPSTLSKLESTLGAPVLEAYGMTEASHQMASNPLPEDGKSRPGSVGKGTNVEIIIMGDDNKPLPELEKGEVCIKGKNVTLGYHNRPDANIANFTEGWFRTGDQGYLEDGYLTLTGRIKELINRGGEKISPIELDSLLLEHPKVQAAVSFSVPDEKYGEEVNAAVVCKFDIIFLSKKKKGILIFNYYSERRRNSNRR